MAGSDPNQALQHVLSGEFQAIAPCIDTLELQAVYRAEFDQRPELRTLQLLGHIYNGNLEDARFVYKRASNTQKQDAQFQAAWAILQHLWNRDYQGVWSTFGSVDWPDPFPQLIQAIAVKQRQQILHLVSLAYSSIQPERLAALTGTTAAEVPQLMQQEGWQVDEAKNVILVKRKQDSGNAKASVDHLQHLTEIVVQLEA